MTSNEPIIRYTPGITTGVNFGAFQEYLLCCSAANKSRAFEISWKKIRNRKHFFYIWRFFPKAIGKMQTFRAPLPNNQNVLTEAWPIDFDRLLFSSVAWITVSFMRLKGAKSAELHIVFDPIAKQCSNIDCHGNAVYTIKQSSHADSSLIFAFAKQSLPIVPKDRAQWSAKINTFKVCYSNRY